MTKLLKIADLAAKKFLVNDPAIELNDLIQEARIAAIRASKTYDPNKAKSPNASLEAWVWINVMKELTRFLNRRHRHPATLQFDDVFQEKLVSSVYVMEQFDTIEQKAVRYAIELFESGEHRTRIRARIKEKFGKKVFYRIRKKLEG